MLNFYQREKMYYEIMYIKKKQRNRKSVQCLFLKSNKIITKWQPLKIQHSIIVVMNNSRKKSEITHIPSIKHLSR